MKGIQAEDSAADMPERATLGLAHDGGTCIRARTCLGSFQTIRKRVAAGAVLTLQSHRRMDHLQEETSTEALCGPDVVSLHWG